jgi:hypothetical protein
VPLRYIAEKSDREVVRNNGYGDEQRQNGYLIESSKKPASASGTIDRRRGSTYIPRRTPEPESMASAQMLNLIYTFGMDAQQSHAIHTA